MRRIFRRSLPAACLVMALCLAGQAAAVEQPGSDSRISTSPSASWDGVLRQGAGADRETRDDARLHGPPLKPEADFFVMTKEPVSLCPFCQSDAEWPADIVVVYLRKGTSLTSNQDPVEVIGTLEVGSKTDPRTGFVSLLRIVDARLRRL